MEIAHELEKNGDRVAFIRVEGIDSADGTIVFGRMPESIPELLNH
jgi:hypothetical protein